LEDLIESIRSRFTVLPQPVSRYQRGVVVDGRPPTEVPLLTRDEYRLLKMLAHAKQKYARRACALIALHHGATQTEAGAYAGLTDRRVRHWLAEFREKRLGIFPQAVLDAETNGHDSLSTHSEADEASAALLQPVGWATPAMSPPAPSQDSGPGLDADDTMTEAARKTLRFQFLAMLAQEEATRAGGDSEALHKMRVATRRMRAAARVFKSYVKKKALKPYLRGLRRTAGVLGQVRDLDVAQEKAEAYLQSDAGNGADLDPILISWQAAREEARAKLLTYLDSDPFTTFKTGFGEFLEHPFPKPKRLESKVVPQALRHIVPVEIYQRLATVRAYGPAVTNAEVTLADYHSLRIATKRLRYTLEFFEEILGADARLAIQELKNLQDYLGDLQDAVVASDRLRNFWLWGTWDLPADGSFPARPVRSILAPGVARYHAARQIEIQEALDGFPDFWQRFSGPSFGTLVAKAVSVL
jgi:CHAD domain-containing protein